ncbi:MAG: ribonuclease HII [Deltaproteobacteria bacterium]|nr:ribonuclease HII [Deltaproteobacteria bacterium]MBW1954638.1 ribonuclease HII [Deltaproteobacteria bacterium]MBW2040490.1 ribonuclease HII [Deltaproteobacteria bacterium]MBW2131358.1 ribonuclease HII [Deltaproteobacteria bacterium]
MARDQRVFEKESRKNGFFRIAGVDEAGRGPLAGPVVAAAVVLPADVVLPGVTDSKKLSPAVRDRLYDTIYSQALAIGIGIVDAVEIDRINILRAALLSMAVAAGNLSPPPHCLLIDGNHRIPIPIPQRPIPKGDTLSLSIAAASIVAKVTRDRLMDRYALWYPEFDFSRHKGYPTKAHKEAIRCFGCTPIHRKTFKGVREHIA